MNYALGVLWSLSVEEVFYLVFPVLCVLLGRGKGFVLWLLAMIAYAAFPFLAFWRRKWRISLALLLEF